MHFAKDRVPARNGSSRIPFSLCSLTFRASGLARVFDKRYFVSGYRNTELYMKKSKEQRIAYTCRRAEAQDIFCDKSSIGNHSCLLFRRRQQIAPFSN
jgi:hypothetical protein